ncbi:MAG TPA: NAD(P)H-quinone oxidoreductase subunit O [Leptolyngbyaceae cyanobacterium]
MATPLKRGDLVQAIRENLENSVEAKASDTRFPAYIFETKGEIVDIRNDYALVKFGHMPAPNVWLRLDQLRQWPKAGGGTGASEMPI